MIRLLALATLAVIPASPEATAGCRMSYCTNDSVASSAPATAWTVTNQARPRRWGHKGAGAGKGLTRAGG